MNPLTLSHDESWLIGLFLHWKLETNDFQHSIQNIFFTNKVKTLKTNFNFYWVCLCFSINNASSKSPSKQNLSNSNKNIRKWMFKQLWIKRKFDLEKYRFFKINANVLILSEISDQIIQNGRRFVVRFRCAAA